MVAASSMIVLGPRAPPQRRLSTPGRRIRPIWIPLWFPMVSPSGSPDRSSTRSSSSHRVDGPAGSARTWRPSPNGKIWTFNLRRGSSSTTARRSTAAVCANFNRWYNWTGPFQDASASYYYRQLFGGFKKNESADWPAAVQELPRHRPVR